MLKAGTITMPGEFDLHADTVTSPVIRERVECLLVEAASTTSVLDVCFRLTLQEVPDMERKSREGSSTGT